MRDRLGRAGRPAILPGMPDDAFDPYHVWLGIPPEEQPPDHYRLLGIAAFERSAAVITLAAQRQMAHVKNFSIGRHSELSQRLLNELAKAKLCLLNPAKRTKYDAALKARIEAATRARAPAHARKKSWVVGSAANCDLVVNEPTVSGRHCRLVGKSSGTYLEDLGSTNGTFVNGCRITSRQRVSSADLVRLGRRVSLPWPDDLPAAPPRVIRIGAFADNDVVIDRPMISSHHARLTIDRCVAVMEDLNSTNGTALGDPRNKIRQAPVSESDIVYFGSHGVSVAELLHEAAMPPGRGGSG